MHSFSLNMHCLKRLHFRVFNSNNPDNKNNTSHQNLFQYKILYVHNIYIFIIPREFVTPADTLSSKTIMSISSAPFHGNPSVFTQYTALSGFR